MTVWFTVKLDDRPGSLARVATALGDRGVNITGIVGVAEDTDGALMLTTSDAAATRGGVRRSRAAVRGARSDRRDGARIRCRSATFDPGLPAAARSADAEAAHGRDGGDPVRHRRLGRRRCPASIDAVAGRRWTDPNADHGPPGRGRPATRRDRARGRGHHRGGPGRRARGARRRARRPPDASPRSGLRQADHRGRRRGPGRAGGARAR